MTDRLIGTYYQGTDEQIIYSITTTSWGSTPTSVTYKVYDVTGGSRTDATITTMTGDATVSGDVITLPALKGLTVNKVYRVEVKFTSGSNIFEPYFVINAEY